MNERIVEEKTETIVYRRTLKRSYLEVLIPVRLRLSPHDISEMMVVSDDHTFSDIYAWWIKSIQPGENAFDGCETWEQLSHDGDIIINGVDGTYVLTLDRFTNGLLLFLRTATKADKPGYIYFDEHRRLRIDPHKIGCSELNTIIQYALFGDVVYEE